MPTTTRAATTAVIRLDMAVSLVKEEPELKFSEIVDRIMENEGRVAKAASIEQNLTYPFGFRGDGARTKTLEAVGLLARGESARLDDGFVERLRSHGRHRPEIVSRLLGQASPRYWLAGTGDSRNAPRMMRKGVWDKMNWRQDDRSSKAKTMWRRFWEISIGDWVAVKSSTVNEAPKDNLWIHFVGRVKAKDESEGTLRLSRRHLEVKFRDGLSAHGKGVLTPVQRPVTLVDEELKGHGAEKQQRRNRSVGPGARPS